MLSLVSREQPLKAEVVQRLIGVVSQETLYILGPAELYDNEIDYTEDLYDELGHAHYGGPHCGGEERRGPRFRRKR